MKRLTLFAVKKLIDFFFRVLVISFSRYLRTTLLTFNHATLQAVKLFHGFQCSALDQALHEERKEKEDQVDLMDQVDQAEKEDHDQQEIHHPRLVTEILRYSLSQFSTDFCFAEITRACICKHIRR